MTREEIGQRIKKQRELLGWTQEQLADKIGVQQATMSQYETGKRGLEATELANIAAILGVKAGYFYGEEKPPTLVVDVDAQGNITRTQTFAADDAAEIKATLLEMRETLKRLEEKTVKSDGNKP